MTIKKYFSFSLLLSALILARPELCLAQSKEEAAGFVDDSIKDLSIVVGSAVGGAILGLSTLSFVDVPSDHLKNIAVGGAIGIVIGVGIVIFSQATRTTNVISSQAKLDMTPDKFEMLSRHEFSEYKIAQNHMSETNIGYNFSF